jgi:hypothetical protein
LVETCAVAEAVLEAVAGLLGVLAAGVDADELVLLDELPQPDRARRPTARVRIESLGVRHVFARSVAWNLTGSDPPSFGAVGPQDTARCRSFRIVWIGER